MKRFNKTDAKASAKAVVKAGAKVPWSEYHLFLREQLGKMKEEDRKNFVVLYQKGGS